MLSSRSRRLKLTRSTAIATKTPMWKAIQNQMLVVTAGYRFTPDALPQS
jgi:hypothetical protein